MPVRPPTPSLQIVILLELGGNIQSMAREDPLEIAFRRREVSRLRQRLGPLGEQGHETASKANADERERHPLVRGLHHSGVEEDLVAQKLRGQVQRGDAR